MMHLNSMLAGAIIMASFSVSLFFFRFWKSTRDRFFLYFALSFALQAVIRGVLNIAPLQNEESPVYYLARLVAYALILIAILEKNKNQDKR